jgi:type IV fimbrial biogenesis protein FimT
MDSNAGFTLVELVITIAIAAIVVTVAVPGFQGFVLNNRMSGNANDMIATLGYGRSEAVKRAADVTVCASDDGATCSGTWADGWVVLDGAGNVLRAQEALGGTTTLAGADTIVFNANGRMTTPAAATVLTLCPGKDGIQGRQIAIEPTGRARVVSAACS